MDTRLKFERKKKEFVKIANGLTRELEGFDQIFYDKDAMRKIIEKLSMDHYVKLLFFYKKLIIGRFIECDLKNKNLEIADDELRAIIVLGGLPFFADDAFFNEVEHQLELYYEFFREISQMEKIPYADMVA